MEKRTTIYCIGDSLTHGDDGYRGNNIAPHIVEENYPYFLSKLTNSTVHNLGRCGCNATTYLAYYKSSNFNVGDADIIIIMLGTNGGLSIEEDTKGNKDYLELISLLRKQSKAKIYLCTPPHVTQNPIYPFANNVYQAARFIRKVATEFNLPLIDVANSARITTETEKELQEYDALHFSSKGYKVLAEEVFKGLKENAQ